MSAIGIVCEYNPLHKGHLYHIMESKKQYPDKKIVAIMSGDFVQRGEAASFDKHTRAKAALLCGVDLVIELNLPWAVSSAESFARGAVGLLGALPSVDSISFGSECGEVEKLSHTAEILISGELDEKILWYLNSGISYASARQKALEEIDFEASKLIASPNNILGIEYIKAIKTLGLNISPMTVQRVGAGHDQKSGGEVRSASEIRTFIDGGQVYENFVPETAYTIYNSMEAIDRELMEISMLSRLRMLGKDVFENLPDASEGLGNRLYKFVQSENTISDILEKTKTKRYAMSRIRRMLMSACLGIEKGMSDGTPDYIRVLASNQNGFEILKTATKAETLPIITKPAHGSNLSGRALACFELTAKARDFYALAHKNTALRSTGQDLTTGAYIKF